jgi:hypothetical protein
VIDTAQTDRKDRRATAGGETNDDVTPVPGRSDGTDRVLPRRAHGLKGLSRFGSYVLSRVEHEEDTYFILMLCFMAVAGVLADAIQLPGIVGAFLAGLAINASTHDKPASTKLEFLGKSLFIPIFFITTGFLVNPVTFSRGIVDDFPMAAGIIGALLVGKGIAAWIAGRGLGYTKDEQLTVWSLTLPQVAATLAATLVAYQTRDAGGERLLDDQMLNGSCADGDIHGGNGSEFEVSATDIVRGANMVLDADVNGHGTFILEHGQYRYGMQPPGTLEFGGEVGNGGMST